MDVMQKEKVKKILDNTKRGQTAGSSTPEMVKCMYCLEQSSYTGELENWDYCTDTQKSTHKNFHVNRNSKVNESIGMQIRVTIA